MISQSTNTMTQKRQTFTEKQLRFINARVRGAPVMVALREAGYSPTSRRDLSQNADIQVEIDRRLKLVDDKPNSGMMERVEKRKLLARMARNPKLPPRDRMMAIEIDNKMAGHLEPEKIEIFGMGDLLALVRDRSRDEKNITDSMPVGELQP